MLWVWGALYISGLLMMSNREKSETPSTGKGSKPKKPTAVMGEVAREPITPKQKQLLSPLVGVTREQWERFLKVMSDDKNGKSVSKSGYIGYFRFSMPRLNDIGLACNVRKVAVDGKQVWQGDFIPPLTLDGFLESPTVQCKAFALATGDLATRIRSVYPEGVNGDIDGVRASLSGLIAVAHKAGLKGLGSWMSKPEDRKKFPHTTEAFRAANGIF